MAAAALCLIAPLHLSGELYSNVIMMPPLLLALLLVAPQPQGAPLAIALGGLALLLLAVPTDFLNTHSWSRWAFLIPIRMYGALSLWGAFITLRRAGLAPVAAQA
ncbi:MAG: hypothetical protein HGA65_00905 [Oscillochloris sp.]|nr:hypothetical protein [Oscillochloris sp.]